MPAKRVCQIIRLKPERFDEYVKVHAAVWPGVLAALELAHFSDYSIHHDPFKYVGDDWDADMKAASEDADTKRWWQLTDSMQESLVPGATGSGQATPWWLSLDEVFRFEGKA